MADSSPVNGYDWLNSCFTDARSDKLRAILICVRELQTPDLSVQDVGKHTAFLLEQIHDHQMTPVVLGRGAGSLEQKVAGIVWALWLETGSEALLRRICGKSRAWTTDMGTEIGLNDCGRGHDEGLVAPLGLRGCVGR